MIKAQRTRCSNGRGGRLVMTRGNLSLNEIGSGEEMKPAVNIWPNEVELQAAKFQEVTILSLFDGNRASLIGALLYNLGYPLHSQVQVARLNSKVVVRTGRRLYVSQGRTYDFRWLPAPV